VVLVLTALTPVQAVCGGNPQILTRSGAGTSASFVFGSTWANSYYAGYAPFGTTGAAPISANAEATFWALGTGNPIAGPGDDAGLYTFPTYSWMFYNATYYGNQWYGAEINSGWGLHSAIDGCITNAGALACTCVLITDDDGTTGYFAIASNAGVINTWDAFLTQPGTDPAGNFNPIRRLPVRRQLRMRPDRLQGDADGRRARRARADLALSRMDGDDRGRWWCPAGRDYGYTGCCRVALRHCRH